MRRAGGPAGRMSRRNYGTNGRGGFQYAGATGRPPLRIPPPALQLAAQYDGRFVGLGARALEVERLEEDDVDAHAQRPAGVVEPVPGEGAGLGAPAQRRLFERADEPPSA